MEDTFKVLVGDSFDILDTFPENYFDSVVTDPPYGLGKEPDPMKILPDWLKSGYAEIGGKGFMGNEWDAFVPQPALWKKVIRVMKPGAHALVFCGTRTQDWMTLSLRLAGFEVRDVIAWHYATGFPKSVNISKIIDKKKGKGKVIGSKKYIQGGGNSLELRRGEAREVNIDIVELESEEAKKWEGWGTALKPATELITLVRKPLSESTIADNVLKWGTGCINIDECRIPTTGKPVQINVLNGWSGFGEQDSPEYTPTENVLGRWPANVIFDETMTQVLDSQYGYSESSDRIRHNNQSKFSGKENGATCYGKYNDKDTYGYSDSGGASRFFFCAKPSQRERNFGLAEFGKKSSGVGALRDSGRGKEAENFHPTVKAVKLMQYLVKMVTPVGGICLDPFAGSCTTGLGCKTSNRRFIGIERDPEYAEIGIARMNAWNSDINF